MIQRLHTSVSTTLLVAALFLTTGCSLYKANSAYDQERYEDAIRAYQDVLAADPGNVKARIGYRRAATRAAEVHLEKAHEAERAKDDAKVYLAVRRAAVLDPTNAIATDWLMRLEQARQLKDAGPSEESLESQREKALAKSTIMLDPRDVSRSMGLEFRGQKLREILEALCKAAGINLLFHHTFTPNEDKSITANLGGLPFQKILDTLMLQTDCFYKVLDTNTIMVFKGSVGGGAGVSRDLYENQLIQTFYLSNADPNDVRTALSTILPNQNSLKAVVDKRLNAITVKAKPTDLAIANRIVNQLDKAKAEVMIYLELLEVTESQMEQVGLMPVLTSGDISGVYRLGATLATTPTGGINQNDGGIRISKSDLRFLFPSLALDAMKSSGDAKLIASPNVRVITGDTGEVLIGESLSQVNSVGLGGTGYSGGSTSAQGGYIPSIPTASFSNQDVGVKIKITPRVHFNEDVTLEIDSDISSKLPSSKDGRIDIGKRNIKTKARLRNGETIAFGGLLKEDEQKSLQGLWGLSDIPFLGKLFGHNTKSKTKTDVILTVRAVLVRKPDLHAEDFAAFDPDMLRGDTGPFAPKPAKPSAGTLPATATAAPVITPSTTTPPSPGSKDPANTQQKAKPAPPTPFTDSGDLVLFLSPVSTQIPVGERVPLNLFVSGAKGLTSGKFSLRADPKLKILSIKTGDFLSGDGGALESGPVAADGSMSITFKKTLAEADSGTLAEIMVEGIAPGQATLQIMDGSYLAGANPISGRVVGSLIVVQ